MMTKRQAWLIIIIIVMEMLRRINACKYRFSMAAWLLRCLYCVVRCVCYMGQCSGVACAGDELLLLCAHAHAVSTWTSANWVGEKRSDDAVEGRVGVRWWYGAVEE